MRSFIAIVSAGTLALLTLLFLTPLATTQSPEGNDAVVDSPQVMGM
jgi:hypothetical protein